MIKPRIGDLLVIKEGRKHYYVVVLTKVVQFGGHIVFAFHNAGKKCKPERLTADHAGFNICTDLLLPNREGRIERLTTFDDVADYWRTKFVKGTPEWRAGVKAVVWFIHKVNKLGGRGIECRGELSPEYRHAMDDGCHSFDLVAAKVLARYTPDQNEHL